MIGCYFDISIKMKELKSLGNSVFVPGVGRGEAAIQSYSKVKIYEA